MKNNFLFAAIVTIIISIVLNVVYIAVGFEAIEPIIMVVFTFWISNKIMAILHTEEPTDSTK